MTPTQTTDCNRDARASFAAPIGSGRPDAYRRAVRLNLNSPVNRNLLRVLGRGNGWLTLLAAVLICPGEIEVRRIPVDKKSVYWRRKLGLPIGPRGPKPLFARSKYMLKKHGPNTEVSDGWPCSDSRTAKAVPGQPFAPPKS